jgi:hypothetical protein
MPAAQNLDMVSQHRVITDCGMSDDASGAHVNSLANFHVGVAEQSSGQKAAVQWTPSQSQVPICIPKYAAGLAGDETQELSMEIKPDIPAGNFPGKPLSRGPRKDQDCRHAVNDRLEDPLRVHFRFLNMTEAATLSASPDELRPRPLGLQQSS